jgi:glycosyltransferase involved in cell wall biosynthesis
VKRNDYPSAVRTLRAVEKQVAERAEQVIVPSEYLKGIVMAWGIPGEKISVVYNAFNSDLPTASKEVLRKKFNYGHPVIISVGRMVPWKGFKGLMDAAAPLVEEFPRLTLEIVGSGDRGEYESYAKEKGYEFVHFSPNQSHDEILSRIKAADCFALNTGYEGLSHVILEAMALGTPVVTTDVGGNTELFAAHRRNLLAHYNEIPQLSALISYTIIDPIGARKAAEESSRFVSNMTERRMMEETTALLLSVV